MNDLKLSIQENGNAKLSLVEKVEIELIRYLVEHKLKPGDIIPKEIDLVEQLGVSRTVIREAMMRLRMIGILESKKHRGTIISNPDLLGMLEKTLHPHILDQETLRDIFEMRLVIEVGMCDLVFERSTRGDIKALKLIVEDEPERTESYIFEIAHEIKFHSKLYEIAGNNTLNKFQSLLLPSFQYVYDSGLLSKDILPHKHVSHKGLVDVLEHGSPELLRNAMRAHLENHFQRIFRK